MAPMKIPENEEQRNIIDKLANFVARNGPKFEELTKSKQKDNEKFAFLFGGEYHPYYLWKVGLETTQVNAQKKLQEHSQKTTDNSQPIQNQQGGPPTVPTKRPEFDLTEFKELLQKLVLACTKDNIQNGKNWIVTNANTDSNLKACMRMLLRRMVEETLPFQQKLHIVYLANDILHHSRKKDLPQLQDALQYYILPITAMTYNGERPENQDKLIKVLNIWENQKFFSDSIREKLKNINALYDHQLDIIDQEKTELDLEKESKGKEEEELRRQKQEEVKRRAEEILQQRQQQLQQQQQPLPPPQDYQYGQYKQFNQWNQPPPPPLAGQPDPYHYYGGQQQFPPPPVPYDQPRPGFPPFPGDQGGYDHHHHPPPPPPGPGSFGQYGHPQPVQTFDYSHQSVPTMDGGGAGGPVTFDYEHGNAPLPDGAPPIHEAMHDPTIPLAPYYDLPAGLMVPLVKLWDCEYRPLDAKDLRLPIPQPPSERLLAAIEAFYAPPSHDRPRDSQGWEKNGLFEFFKAKLKYIKDKERKLEVFDRTPSPPPSRSSTPELDGSELIRDAPPRSRSPSPLMSINLANNIQSQRGRSRSRSRSRERRRPSKSRSRSFSPSPRKRRSRSRSYSRSRSRSRSRSKSRSKSRSRSRTPPRKSPIRRSPTPPEAFQGFTETRSLESRIEESNVGHQLLKKMGWGGQGLGKKESGILDPIKQAEVRDRQDQFKGIGVEMNDPFEQYRKSKSYTYGKPRERRR